MPGQTTERAFETYVEEILLTRGGWKSGTNAEWDKERALVHFAADPDEVHMTTRLAGERTQFLPFNRGSHPGQIICGTGNPQHESGYRTGYFWEEVLR